MVAEKSSFPRTDRDRKILEHVRALSSNDTYARKHAAWMLARIAEKGDIRAVVEAGAVPLLEKLAPDNTTVEICSPNTSSIERTTVSRIVKGALERLRSAQ